MFLGKVINAFPEISSWVIGGRSLGGSMASNYVYSNPNQFSGLIFLASYPQESKNLINYDISVS
ncbi:MAG: hypothetical protein EU530_09495 [Promethearchaeota archaeon]|nr:MAG: hypothetical protein EU530_09495 [Candidatus Lokiarchaeota archaeon]